MLGRRGASGLLLLYLTSGVILVEDGEITEYLAVGVAVFEILLRFDQL